MNTLFNDRDVFQKERPTGLTEQQKADFYSKRAKEIIQEGFSEDEEEDIIHDLKRLYPFNDNGFQMAKSLERYSTKSSYSIDTAFCEWLEGLSGEWDNIKRDNVKAWVKAHNPQPKFTTGTKLIINARLCYGMEAGKVVYVNGGRPEEAVYWINETLDLKGGIVFSYEKVESCCTPA